MPLNEKAGKGHATVQPAFDVFTSNSLILLSQCSSHRRPHVLHKIKNLERELVVNQEQGKVNLVCRGAEIEAEVVLTVAKATRCSPKETWLLAAWTSLEKYW